MRKNPRRPVTEADVEAAKEKAFKAATDIEICVIFMALLDYRGFNVFQLKRLWKKVTEISESIERDPVKMLDTLTKGLEDLNFPRIPPVRSPREMTVRELNRLRNAAQKQGQMVARLIIFSALKDAERLNPVELKKAWDATQRMRESYEKGYVKIRDLKEVLNDEYDVVV